MIAFSVLLCSPSEKVEASELREMCDIVMHAIYGGPFFPRRSLENYFSQIANSHTTTLENRALRDRAIRGWIALYKKLNSYSARSYFLERFSHIKPSIPLLEFAVGALLAEDPAGVERLSHFFLNAPKEQYQREIQFHADLLQYLDEQTIDPGLIDRCNRIIFENRKFDFGDNSVGKLGVSKVGLLFWNAVGLSLTSIVIKSDDRETARRSVTIDPYANIVSIVNGSLNELQRRAISQFIEDVVDSQTREHYKLKRKKQIQFIPWIPRAR